MKPSFQLIDSGWDKVIQEATTADRTELRVVCPFIKMRAAKRLLVSKRPDLIRVITRFHLGEMCDGVNDTEHSSFAGEWSKDSRREELARQALPFR